MFSVSAQLSFLKTEKKKCEASSQYLSKLSPWPQSLVEGSQIRLLNERRLFALPFNTFAQAISSQGTFVPQKNHLT